MHPDWVSHEFARLTEEAGLPHIGLHDMRHTHATLMLKAGVHPKVVSERLGHSTVAFTLDTYSPCSRACRPKPPNGSPTMVVGGANGS